MPLDATYDPTLSRVRLAGTLLAVTSSYAVFDRSTDGGITHTTIRGGGHVPITDRNASVDDYEFPAGVAVSYRVRTYNPSDVLQETTNDSITQDLDQVWVKVIARPFLNRAIIVGDVGPVTRQSRNGVFSVVGRSFPVAVGDVRGSRQFTLQVLTETAAQARDFDLLLASGEPVFLHVPSTSTRVPTGYYFAVGDTEEAPTGRISERRLFTLPLTEIAAPGSDVVGAAGTWQTVVAAYPTWTATLAAHPTWNDVLELIGTPSEIIVP